MSCSGYSAVLGLEPLLPVEEALYKSLSFKIQIVVVHLIIITSCVCLLTSMCHFKSPYRMNSMNHIGKHAKLD